jgi:hypothetical protein
MDTVREAILNALGLCETLLALRNDLPADLAGDLVEGAERVRSQLMTAAETLDTYEGN